MVFGWLYLELIQQLFFQLFVLLYQRKQIRNKSWRKFKYKDQTHDDFNIGVIAQQVESVAPEFVDVDGWEGIKCDEDGNIIHNEEEPLKSIYTADLHHATIKVLQEAMAKIEKLEAEIDTLKK